MKSRVWGIAGAIGAAATATYFFLMSPLRDHLYTAIGLAAAAAIVVGIRINRPAFRLPWYLFAAGQLSFVAGDFLFTLYEAYLRIEPFPSVADVFYLAGYPLWGTGLWLLIRRRTPGRDIASALDAAIVTTAIGMIAWAYLVTPSAEGGSFDIGTAVSVAYPLGCILLLGFFARLLTGPGKRNTAFHLIGAGLFLTLAADAWYSVAVMEGTYSSGHIMDAGWLLAYVAWGAAALHPSMIEVARRAPQRDETLTTTRLVVLTGAALMAPGFLVFDAATGRTIHASLIATGSVILFMLVVLRLAGVTREIQTKAAELDAQGKGLRAALEARELLEQQLRHQAFHDPLTNLPNRWLFADRLDHAIARQRRTGQGIAVIFVDLDDFKNINDTLGHAAGDQLLITVATRLLSCLREPDTAARFGGDEFAILLDGIERLGDIDGIGARVAEIFDTPFRVGDSEFSLHSSIGAAVCEDPITADEVMRRADIAMYIAKAQPAKRYIIFDEASHGGVVKRRELQGRLNEALARGELKPYFQPIVDLMSGKLLGVEALVRWEHPARGLVPPDEFIPLAEETGLIIDIDRLVIEQSCDQVARWQRELPDCGDLVASVNVAVADIQQARFVEQIKEILDQAQLAPEHLTLEITERSLLRDVEGTIDRIQQLRGMGAQIAIDDFGTGYSSLSYLQRFPIDILKIDRSFVESVTGDVEDSALAKAVIKLGQILRAIAHAEGIETKAQAERLIQLGCFIGQGFYFSKALPADEFAAHVHRHGPFFPDAQTADRMVRRRP